MKPIILLSLFGSWFASAGEIAFVTFLIILMSSVIVYSYFFYKKKQRLEHAKLMRRKYETYLLKLDFSDEELSLIHKLTTFLESDELCYHMLTNKHLFLSCVSQLKNTDKPDKVLLETIKRKLNFSTREVNGNYFSSEDLPAGMPALLILDDTKKISASIKDNSKSSLNLKLNRIIPPLREGTTLSVYFHDNQKIFTINTNVLEHREDMVTISHSLLKSQKRRAFKRSNVKLPVVIKHTDYEEIPMHSYITDLSEGGASLENPDFNFKKNERLTLFYHTDTDDGFHIRGEVLRLSAKGRIIHVKFFDRDLTIRSRIKTIVN
ncbi:MAG: PilZ domain-containing protein [Spirochaetaceae bacterium]|nr:PilZ domain-containing protein [Spirochaetaceae bacterium]